LAVHPAEEGTHDGSTNSEGAQRSRNKRGTNAATPRRWEKGRAHEKTTGCGPESRGDPAPKQAASPVVPCGSLWRVQVCNDARFEQHGER
jgi:hypothetical protein